MRINNPKITNLILSVFLLMGNSLLSCSNSKKPSENLILDLAIENIEFNADSAYSYIEKQLSFGPRVPGTVEHKNCSDWLTEKLNNFVDTIYVQHGVVMAFNGDKLPISNIYGKLNPSKGSRVLLLAHYDTRPWADEDPDKSKMNLPIPGANDGASGVAVILELARVLKENGFNGGVDYLLIDAEDYGVPSSYNGNDNQDSWCLGTQYWLQQLSDSKADIPDYVILLDMVGGKNARFNPEYFSSVYAGPLINKIWDTASRLGYREYFPREVGNPITDDHIYFLKEGIPAIDIVENSNPETGSFNPTWHTHADDLQNIDKNTLSGVGATIQGVIMNY